MSSVDVRLFEMEKILGMERYLMVASLVPSFVYLL